MDNKHIMYVSARNGAPKPVFPKMPQRGVRNTQNEPQPQNERNENFVSEEGVRSQRKESDVQAPEPERKNVSASVITPEKAREGFKMSIILGEPVSGKYFGRQRRR